MRGVVGMLVIPLLMVLGMSARAESGLPVEKTLDNVTTGSTYLEVLFSRGAPHGVGPVTGAAGEIWNLLDPPPVAAVSFLKGAQGLGIPEAGAPRMRLYGAMGGKGYKLKPDYTVWEYLGSGPNPNPGAGWATYVLFDSKGKVISVALSANTPSVSVPVRTKSGVGIGTPLIDLARIYSWPDPLQKFGSQYFCAYEEQNVAYSLDVASRKVMAIAIGSPVTVSLLARREAAPKTRAKGPTMNGLAAAVAAPVAPAAPAEEPIPQEVAPADAGAAPAGGGSRAAPAGGPHDY